MNSSTEEIKSRLNIVDIVGEYVRLQKAGANWKAPCPFHNEKTPSFMVSEEKQIWHCFGCGKGGDVFGFLMELEGLVFKEALKVLADKAGVQLPRYNPEAVNSKNRTLEILELAAKFYEKQLWDGTGKKKILNYLRERGLNDESIRSFRLGYAPDGWRNILQFLIGRGYKTEEINKTGLLVKKENNSDANLRMEPESTNRYYDRFRDRIIFPIADAMGKIIGFSARVAPGGDESQAKYVNTPETDAYHKSRVLYGIDKAKLEIKNQNSVLLVEGNMDVIAAAQAGIKNTVAVSGTAFTPDQLDILKRYTENTRIFFDMDEAGQAAAVKSAKIAFQKEFNVFMVELKDAKDAAEAVAQDPKKLLAAVNGAVPAMDYFFGKILARYDKTKAGDKKTIARDVLNLIVSLENKIERSHWVKKLAEELEVDEKIIIDILNKTSAPKRNAAAEEKKEKETDPQKRIEIIREKIAGLMLADSLVWEKIAGLEKDNVMSFLEKDELLSLLIKKGKQVGFKMDNILPAMENSAMADTARKLYHSARYQFDAQQNIKESAEDDNWPIASRYLDDIRKEICKEKLATITRDIKKAEAGGDKEAVNFLMQEFSKLSKELK